MGGRRKAVWVDEDLWEQLMKLKVEMRAKSISEVLRQLLNMPPPSTSAGEGEEGASASASAGAPAGAPVPQLKPSKLVSGSWGFCPECLSIYALEQAECPKCEVALVSLMDEEGKELYRRLKAEKG